MKEDLFDDERDAGLEALVRLIREETDALHEILPDAVARQWTPSPVPMPREDTTERASGGRADPTGSTALDGRRIQVRESVREAERILREAAIRTRGVRLFMERAISQYDGGKA